jgi:hypothetical protein
LLGGGLLQDFQLPDRMSVGQPSSSLAVLAWLRITVLIID